ncbi:haloacid dehalogenase, partial [Streptomyces sp. PT12]
APARAAGMHTALVRRGPWAVIQWETDDARKLPTLRINSLAELPEQIEKLNAQER